MQSGPKQARSQNGQASANVKNQKENPKRRLILNAALKLFCENGYDTSSMDEVAQTAGVSKATVYAHFKNKETLLLETVRDNTDAFASRMSVGPLKEPFNIVETLRLIAEKQMALLLSPFNFNMLHLVASQAPRIPEVGRIYLDEGASKILDELAALLSRASDEGQLNVPDPELAADQFLNLVRGDIPFLRMLQPQLPVKDKLKKQIEAALNLFISAYQIR